MDWKQYKWLTNIKEVEEICHKGRITKHIWMTSEWVENKGKTEEVVGQWNWNSWEIKRTKCNIKQCRV